MNLKILVLLLLYYSILSSLFLLSDGFMTEQGFQADIALDDSELNNADIDKGGLFNTGVNFGRFFIFIGFGVGLSSDTPTWFSLMFGLWQTLVTILSIAFIIDSIWSG